MYTFASGLREGRGDTVLLGDFLNADVRQPVVLNPVFRHEAEGYAKGVVHVVGPTVPVMVEIQTVTVEDDPHELRSHRRSCVVNPPTYGMLTLPVFGGRRLGIPSRTRRVIGSPTCYAET